MSEWIVYIGVGVGMVTVTGLFWALRRCKRNRKKIYPKNIIILHMIPRIRETPNLSPFAIKLETYIRMAKLPYQVEYTYEMSPKKKTPWMSYNEDVVSDSQFIIEYVNKKFNVDLNHRLTDEQRGIARAMQKMAEENLYWTLALSRWVYGFSDPSFKKLIYAPKCIIWKIKRNVEKQAYCQGIGRHTPSEVEHIAMGDLQAFSDFIGKKKFLMGVDPCETDCAIFGILACSRQMPDRSFFTKAIEDNLFPNLTAYFERMKDLYWPDWIAPDNMKVKILGLQPPRS